MMTHIDIIHYTIFGFLALVTLGSALKVASTRSIIHAAFWLFPVFAGIAGFYLYLDAQFLAAIQVLIYIGAILVLIVFAVTLTRNAANTDEAQSNRFVVPVILAAFALLASLAAVMPRFGRPVANIDGVMLVPGVAVTDVQAIGLVLLQKYLLPFEITSVLLLASMVGAIVLARKDRPEPREAVAAATPVAEKSEERELAQV